jgi:hypothetical protein
MGGKYILDSMSIARILYKYCVRDDASVILLHERRHLPWVNEIFKAINEHLIVLGLDMNGDRYVLGLKPEGVFIAKKEDVEAVPDKNPFKVNFGVINPVF